MRRRSGTFDQARRPAEPEKTGFRGARRRI